MKIEDQISKDINEGKEKRRKEGKLSINTIKQLEVLERYYKIDRVNRIVTVRFHYEDVNEIIDSSVASISHPVLKTEILSNLSSIAHSIPVEFKIHIDVKIDNFRNYSHDTIYQALLDTLQTFKFNFEKEKRISALKVVGLIVIGVVIFSWLFYLCSKHWFGESGDPTHDTIHEIVYTIAAVVLWEAVYIIFLPEKEYKDISYSILHRTTGLSLYDKNNKLIKDKHNKLLSIEKIILNRKENNSKNFLLVSGTALICLAFCNLTDIVEACLLVGSTTSLIPHIIIIILTSIVEVFAGIGAISYYRDKGPFRNLVPLFGLISFATNTASIIYLSTIFESTKQVTIKGITLSAFTIIIIVLYFLSIIRLNKIRKQKFK